ncbi:MAG TPA: hypothetical protein VM165_14445 [Planctomycetaceae bacterium]|nr:hypothetical protein [Planctomycetaceae bacterium]
MTLALQHRWEHALIAATVEAASRNCPECQLGRTAIQKLLYFLNVLGVPMRYSFDIHHYGPFCSSVMHDVDWLLADDVIVDESNEDRYSLYRPGEGWSELSACFADQLDEYRDQIQNVCEALCDLSPRTLELIATLDFSYRWVRAGGGTGPWKNASIAKFKSIKKDKFTDDEINEWHDVLVNAGLIET